MPVNFRFDGSHLKQPQIEEDDSWEITKGVKAGYHQTLGLFGGLKALAGSVLDDDEWLYDGLEYYQEKMDDASLYAGDVERIEDAESISDYLSYAAYTLGTVAPTIVGTGGVGALAGFATKKVISKSVAEASKTIAKNASSKEAGEALARKYAQVTLGKRGSLATIAGAATTSMGLESGAAFGRIYEEEGTENPVPALAAGIAAGSLEALGALKVLKRILPDGQFLFAKQQIAEETLKKRGLFNRVLREGAKGAGIEGVTEGIQEIIQQGAVSYVKQQNNPELEGQFIELMTEEAALSGYLNSFVAGALGGGAIRGGMGIFGEQTDPPELTEKEQQQVDDLKRPKLQPTELPAGLPTPQSIDIRETTARREERQAGVDAQINEPFPQPDTGRQERKQDAVRQINEGLSSGARARVLVQDLLEEADDLAQSEGDTRARAQQDVRDRMENLPDQREPGQTPEQIRARIRKQEDLDRQRGRRAERRDRDLPDRDVIYGFDLIEKPPKRPKETIPQADRRQPIVDAMNQPIDQSGTPLDRAVGQIVTYEGIEGVLVRGEEGFYIETADGREFIERGESGTLETLGIDPTGRFPEPNLGITRTVDYNPDDNTFVVNRGRGRSKRYKYLGTNTRDDGVFEVVAETENGELRNFVSPKIVRQLLRQIRESEQSFIQPVEEKPVEETAPVEPQFTDEPLPAVDQVEPVESEPVEQQDQPVEIDQPDIVTKTDGTAFKTRKEARLKLKQYPDYKIVAVDDGFELHEPEFYKANIRNKRSEQVKKNFKVTRVNPDRDDLLLAVAKYGGLNREISLSEGVDPAELKTTRVKGLWVFPRSGGMTWDDMTTYLAQHQYVDGLVDFRDKFFDSIAGRQTYYAPPGQEWAAEQAYNEMLANEQDRLLSDEEADADALENVSQFENITAPDGAMADEGASIDEMLLALSVIEARNAGLSNDDILTALTEYENDTISARQELNFLRLDNERSEDTTGSGDEAGRSDTQEAQAQASTQGVFGQVPSGSEKQTEAEYYGLESETEAARQDREQQIQRQQDAESTRQLEAQQRQQADTEAKDFRLSGSDAPADTAMAGGQRNLLDTDKTKFSEATDNIPTETTKAESQKDATVLNNRFALQFQDKSWRDAFEQVEAPGQFAEVANAIEKAFGRRTVFVRPTDKKFDTFRGVYVPQNKKTLYVNANSQVNFASVVGHEMLHDLKNTRKDLYNYLLSNAKTHFQNIDAYKAKLKDADNVDIEQEILADFTGDAFTDPAFMEQLAKDNPSKFKQLLNAITQWIQKLVNKLKGFESDQYFDDVTRMRDYLREVLDAFASDRPIGATGRQTQNYDETQSAKDAAKAKGLGMSMADRMDRAETYNYTTDAFHGSTHNVIAMDAGITSPDSDWGRGIYNSNSIDDVNVNYAGFGDDLTNRIERDAENLIDRVLDQFAKVGREKVLNRLSRSAPTENFDRLNDMDDMSAAFEVAKIISTRRLTENQGVVYPLKLNTQNFVTISKKGSTIIEGRDYYNEAVDEVDRDDFDSIEDYEDAVYDRMYEMEADDFDSNRAKVSDTLRNLGVEENLITTVLERFEGDEISAFDLDDTIRRNGLYAEDSEGNPLSTGAISSEVFKALGFKGVIDQTVNDKFGTGSGRTNPMTGVDEDTVHYIVFEGAENQIRSINAAFDPDNMDSPNLLFSQNETKEAGKIKKITDKVAKTLKRNLSPGGLLPKVAFDAKIERDGEIQEREIDIRQLLGLFDKAVKKTDDIEMLNEAWTSRFVEIDSMDNISTEMKSVLKQKRRYIDSMSKEYAAVLFEEAQNFAAQNKTSAAMAKVDLLNTIASNVGRYANRSYRAFDDPKWPDKVPADVKARAIKLFESEGAKNPEFIVNNILKEGTAFDSMQGFIKESKLGAKDLSILKRKKDIAPEIRALLGEYKDPKINFAKTATKMSRLLSNDRFLKRVLENGRGVFLFDENDAPPDHYKRIASDQSSVMSPLNGLYTSPETEQAFKDILDTEQMPDWVRRIVQFNGIVKYGKTVLSPTTQARNWMSASFFAIANGHFNFAKTAKSIENIKTHMSGLGNTEYLKKLARLGVTYDTPNSGEMMDLLRDTNLGDDIINQTGKSKSLPKRFFSLATKLYQFGDDFWKIVGFENELDILMKQKKISREEAEPLAAKRIRDTYPTYSLVGRGIKKLRRFPLAGTFVSFPAEIIRTQFNQFRHLISEIKDPEMRGVVPRRVAGLGMVSGAAYALQEALLSSNDISEEEEESLRLLLPEWSRNSNIAITGRDENGALQYIDLSHMDPYAYFKKPLNALMREQPADDAIVQAGLEFLTPFFGADITASVVNEVWKNKKKSGGKVYNEEDSPENQSLDIAAHLGKGLGPGLANNVVRLWKAGQGEVSPSGKKYKFDEEMKALVGFRMGTFDPKVALYYKTFEFNEAKRASSAILKKVFTDPNKVSDNELEGAFNRAETARRRAFEKMIKIVTAARQSGLNRTKLMSVLRSAGISRKDAKAIIKGEMSKWEMTDSSLKRSLKKADLLFEDGKKISGNYESRWRKIERMLD